jgi:hypothetical protein
LSIPSHFLTTLTFLFVCGACGSDGGTATGAGGEGSSSSGGGPSGSAGSASSSESAQLRFVYEADWKDHLRNCAWISDYRIKFGAIPVPVTATIDVNSAEPTAYVAVDGRPYKDVDVLHLFTCSKSQTSKQTLQLFSKFGTDLQLSAGHKYTVTLAGSAASLVEDP